MFQWFSLGTGDLEYTLRLQTALFVCLHENEMIQVMQDLYHQSVISLKDEIKRCLMGNANFVIMYALSRVLRCTIHYWVVYFDQAAGEMRLNLNPFIPPQQQVDASQKIELLESIGQTSSEFCLLIAATISEVTADHKKEQELCTQSLNILTKSEPRTKSHSKSRYKSHSKSRPESRSKARPESHSKYRPESHSKLRSKSRSKSLSKSCSRSPSITFSISRSKSRSRSYSRLRSRSPSRSYSRSWSKSLSQAHSRLRSRSRSPPLDRKAKEDLFKVLLFSIVIKLYF